VIGLRPIGVVESSLTDPAAAPRQGDEGAPEARLVFEADVLDALDGIAPGDLIVVLTWLDRARRDVLRVHPRGEAVNPVQGVFATRSPHRPNPIGLHEVEVLAVDGASLRVRPLEAVDGTPIVDVKPVLAGRPPGGPAAAPLRSAAVDGFSLAYERTGAGPPVVLLHGWPGDRADFRAVVPRLAESAEAIVPDLRGFGASDKHAEPPADAYSAAAQARSVLALMDELGVERAVIGGYDIGSRIGQAIARDAPERVRALVVSPPLPGIGDRVLTPGAQREFWYQAFHQLPLIEQLLDGDPAAVRAYLRHFWSHWSGPAFELPEPDLDHLVAAYAPPGAFTASVAWYRAGSGTVATSLAEAPPPPDRRIQVPTTVLWPDSDPLFPQAWSDRLGEFFADVELVRLENAGHFVPLEAPDAFTAAITAALAHP
jgi:tRNA-Thr(GGU) m(6)t(6)A37 methyltransferase TsaA